MKKRVVVAMSGGVDSSVAAALLKKQGYEVVGITMCFSLSEGAGKKPSCCGRQGIEDARKVAQALEVRHYVLNMQKPFEKFVVEDFCAEYLHGRTPNPCVRCNQYIKFGALLGKALALDAQFLATGHYARVVKTKQGFELKKARDKKKDQSYFLYRLSQQQLKHILFPLGGYTKDRIRGLARKFLLPVADKPDSQEICFVPDDNYRGFLKKRIAAAIKPGLITDKEGNILGEHKGISFYTIGQREGLGIARGYPIYITGFDLSRNRIIVGRREDALKRGFLVKEVHFVSRPVKNKVAAEVRIRYNHRQARANIEPFKDKIRVSFKEPQFAITPGQSAVFYRRDTVIGGGVIERVIE